MTELDQFHDVAVHAALRAGERTLAHLGRLDPSEMSFKGRRDLVTSADLEAERIVTAALHDRFPDHQIIAEEEVSASVQRSARTPEQAVAQVNDLEALRRSMDRHRFSWIVDPLDGTTNFAHTLPQYAISLALYRDARPLLAVVYAPVLGELFEARVGMGSTLNGRPIHVADVKHLRDAVFATGFPYRREQLDPLANNVGPFNRFILEVRGFRRGGSAALDLAYVAAGRFAFCFEAQLEPWDVAAGALLVREAGGRVTDYQGGDDWLFGRQILASNGGLHETARRRLQEPAAE